MNTLLSDQKRRTPASEPSKRYLRLGSSSEQDAASVLI